MFNFILCEVSGDAYNDEVLELLCVVNEPIDSEELWRCVSLHEPAKLEQMKVDDNFYHPSHEDSIVDLLTGDWHGYRLEKLVYTTPPEKGEE